MAFHTILLGIWLESRSLFKFATSVSLKWWRLHYWIIQKATRNRFQFDSLQNTPWDCVTQDAVHSYLYYGPSGSLDISFTSRSYKSLSESTITTVTAKYFLKGSNPQGIFSFDATHHRNDKKLFSVSFQGMGSILQQLGFNCRESFQRGSNQFKNFHTIYGSICRMKDNSANFTQLK